MTVKLSVGWKRWQEGRKVSRFEEFVAICFLMTFMGDNPKKKKKLLADDHYIF